MDGSPRPASATALLASVVDYAGVFPPAALEMSAAVAEYAGARGTPDAWMLGRFVLPAARLPELAAVRPDREGSDGAWRLSAVVRDGSPEDAESVRAFNARAGDGQPVVDTIEARPETLDGIDWLADAYGASFDVFVEVPAGDQSERWLERVNATGTKGKVRTGGLTREAFPSTAALVAFIDAALRVGVPFKATAGLHHAVRGAYHLTYAAGADVAPMYGYLNVLLATAARAVGTPLGVVGSILEQEDAGALRFTDETVEWGAVTLPTAALAKVRAAHLVSFGSCSFREPVGELHTVTVR